MKVKWLEHCNIRRVSKYEHPTEPHQASGARNNIMPHNISTLIGWQHTDKKTAIILKKY